MPTMLDRPITTASLPSIVTPGPVTPHRHESVRTRLLEQ
jgi:hypothetical protein